MKVSIAPFAFGFSHYMLCSCFCFYQNFILSFFSSCFLNVSIMTADVGKKIKMLTYYILTVHGQGRTIVVCTSIAALRHISALLRILSIHVWKLHVQMQQRARLKVSDLFFFLLIILFKM